MIRLPVLDDPAIRHGFFTREGGVSTGIFASLNCGLASADDAAHVAENRRRVAAALELSADRLVTCKQVHGRETVLVERPWTDAARPQADAMVTRQPGLALGILTADCAPLLLADPVARVIGAAHAGWRGALGGVIEAVVAAMQEQGAAPARIVAAIGPCIGWNSYEVGAEFPAPFLAQDPANAAFFRAAARAGHYRFDLPGYVAARLRGLGLRQVAASGADTAAEPARFFSYRHACLTGERRFGNALSAICLAPRG